MTRVPLIASAPGVEPGRTGSIVELVDVFPTLSELAGLPTPEGLHGVSLVPVLADAASVVKTGAVSFARGIVAHENWAYMRYDDGTEELYDMRIDPGQLRNLTSSPAHRDTVTRLAAALDARLADAGVGGQQ